MRDNFLVPSHQHMHDAPESYLFQSCSPLGQMGAPSSHPDLSEHGGVALLSTRMWSGEPRLSECWSLPWGAQAQQLLGSAVSQHADIFWTE